MCRIKSLKLLILVVTVYIVQIFCIVLPEGYGGSSGNVIAFDQSPVLASDDIHLSKLQLNINHGRAIIKAQKLQHQNYHHKHRSKQLSEVQKLQQEPYSKSYDKNNDFIVRAGKKNRSQKNDTFTGNAIEKTRLKRQLSDLLIVPNTHWCGRGNTANGSYIRLGGALADKCCRRHDNCQLYIPGLSNRYDLFNYRPYTLSHCNCDLRFHTCLKLANDDDAKTIGKLFFNVVQTQCFVLRTERVCQQRALDGTCTQEVIKHKAHLQNNKRF